MAGLALGNGIAARSRRELRSPLRIYAALEMTIGLFGFAIIFALPQLGHWLRPLFQLLWGHDAALNSLRLALSFLILLVPTTAMGLTLPIALEDPGLRAQDFGRAIGFLYGWNTLGAVAGALAGELFLVQAFGLIGTAIAATSLNFFAALIALFLSRERASLPVRRKVDVDLARTPGRLLIVCFATGAVFLCLEVVWFRFLRLYISVSATAFAVMLAAVLAGIGCGGVVAGWLHRRTFTKRLLPLLFLAAALSTILSYLFFPGPSLQKSAQVFYLDRWNEISVLSLALIFPTAFISGAIFPALAAAVQEKIDNRMNAAGVVTLCNTAGAAIGPLLAAFVALPTIGFERTLLVCAALYAIMAVIVSDRRAWSLGQPLGMTLSILAAAIVALFIFFPYARDEMHFANARAPFEQDGEHLVKKIEDTADTLQLLRADAYGEPYYHRLVTNSFSMSSSSPHGQRYMRLFAHLPLALRPESRDALLICYGLGVTADALTRHGELHKIDIVDISRAVLALAPARTGDGYNNPLVDPRVKTFVQDGRFFLQATPQLYDVITGEPPPPKVVGAVNLYTEEFFKLMRSRLKDGGIATFWLPIYQMRVDEIKAILRAFHNAFANASVWAAPDEEWIMLGVNGSPNKIDDAQFKRSWEIEPVHVDLARIGVELPEQLPALFLMGPVELDRLTSETKPLTDLFPKRLTDLPGNESEIRKFALEYFDGAAAKRRFNESLFVRAVWSDEMRAASAPFFDIRHEQVVAAFRPADPFTRLDFYFRRTQLRVPILEIFHTDEFRLQIISKLVASWTRPPAEANRDLVADALARRDYSAAIALLEELGSERQASEEGFFLLIYLYCLNNQVAEAEQRAAAHAAESPRKKERDEFWRALQAEFGFHPPP
jgi:spermidine synthase